MYVLDARVCVCLCMSECVWHMYSIGVTHVCVGVREEHVQCASVTGMSVLY